MYLSHHTCPQTGKKALGSAVEQAPRLSPVRQMHRVGIHHVLSSKTWEPEGAAGFHGIDLEHVHEYFNLVQDLLLAVLCLTLKSAQTGLSSDETKLEDALQEPVKPTPAVNRHLVCGTGVQLGRRGRLTPLARTWNV